MMTQLIVLVVSTTLLLSICGTRQTLAQHHQTTPATQRQPPVFAENYHVKGVLSLPYAELNEPFTAWYDKNMTRSRTDYYGDLYKIYQFGPDSAPEKSGQQYGSLYKVLYVPASFGKLRSSKHRLASTTAQVASETKRACFRVDGGVGYTISAQTVLPNLADFTFDSAGRCPHQNELFRHAKCELWTSSSNVGEKKNTYKMWIRRDDETGTVVPVYYFMLGYDSLLGSHYDRYDVVYHNFVPGGAFDDDFKFDARGNNCGPMPGPGFANDDDSNRSQMVAANPIHEVVDSPHRYDHVDHEFEKFKVDHEKSYDSAHSHRKSWHNFLHNQRFIRAMNRKLKSFVLGVNQYADKSVKELSFLRGRRPSKGYNGGLEYPHKHLKGSSGNSSADLPTTYDWTILGAVTPVKDQAVCGSCWSFGTSGTLEGAYFVKTQKLLKLSQQQMVDCSWAFENNGCDGGEDFRAYKYIMKAGGLATEDDYGNYLGVDGKCHDRDVKKSVKISGFYNVTSNNQEALKHAVKNYGPVTIAIDASRPTFTFYSHGVYYDEKCNNSPDGLDHQVLVTGWTEVDGQLAWIVKNSWSTHWGNNGYILMSARNNNCGVMDAPTVPIIDLD